MSDVALDEAQQDKIPVSDPVGIDGMEKHDDTEFVMDVAPDDDSAELSQVPDIEPQSNELSVEKLESTHPKELEDEEEKNLDEELEEQQSLDHAGEQSDLSSDKNIGETEEHEHGQEGQERVLSLSAFTSAAEEDLDQDSDVEVIEENPLSRFFTKAEDAPAHKESDVTQENIKVKLGDFSNFGEEEEELEDTAGINEYPESSFESLKKTLQEQKIEYVDDLEESMQNNKQEVRSERKDPAQPRKIDTQHQSSYSDEPVESPSLKTPLQSEFGDGMVAAPMSGGSPNLGYQAKTSATNIFGAAGDLVTAATGLAKSGTGAVAQISKSLSSRIDQKSKAFGREYSQQLAREYNETAQVLEAMSSGIHSLNSNRNETIKKLAVEANLHEKAAVEGTSLGEYLQQALNSPKHSDHAAVQEILANDEVMRKTSKGIEFLEAIRGYTETVNLQKDYLEKNAPEDDKITALNKSATEHMEQAQNKLNELEDPLLDKGNEMSSKVSMVLENLRNLLKNIASAVVSKFSQSGHKQ
ncbi:hypothetical protein [Flexibacterium corallicola]|uniref:hypothetical protein n=1 Tax=Flexibacterium corallicola TaxID=3037259 RepID=UPI00286F43F9|nr:hypothetical protein [Pseudovibrio sp. M1P-2-3]